MKLAVAEVQVQMKRASEEGEKKTRIDGHVTAALDVIEGVELPGDI